ncbi:MAG: SIMPL domain-containing protein [Rhizobiaceae bacterium]
MGKKTLVLALAAMALGIAGTARAADEPTPRIIVSGEGEVTAAPDMALISLSVLREAATAREALDANSKAMADVIAAMKEFGIADKDLQTSGFSIQPRYVYPDPNKNENFAPKITGYAVVNSLGVRVRDLAKVGEVLDKSVTLGVNEGGNVTFTKDDTTAIMEEARKKAVEDAVAKAKTLSSTAGVGIGRILEISEQSYRPGPMPMMQAEMAMAKSADSAPVPIAAGENSYRVTVNVTFEIKQ